MDIKLEGTSIIGRARGREGEHTFNAFDPTTGEAVGPDFYSAAADELAAACRFAGEARIPYASLSGKERGRFLRRIADNIEALGEALISRASLESGLTPERFRGERARTCGQLRMFADLLDDGSWVDARIDRALPDREPTPRPDLRSMLRPLGPVAVFCASNFPLAYSVAGGDTTSALAAGCPVIVNAHIAHPGTAELVGIALMRAADECGMPEGVFSLLFSDGYEIGQGLVKNPEIRAVGFTGSRAGGRTIMDIAAARDEPIPVYTEMSSVNPTFILPGAMTERGDELVADLHRAVTSGAGQFCTKPGLIFVPHSTETGAFSAAFEELVIHTQPPSLLTGGIRDAFVRMSDARRDEVAGYAANDAADLPGFAVNPSVFETTAVKYLDTPDLNEEIFGPTTLLIRSDDHAELLKIARGLEGQLTASIHGTDEDLDEYSDLIAILETKAGRLIYNGFSPGVEVCPAMVHGGPYPATSNSRSTAVGTRAITRFSRLVCFQNFPDRSLPDELKAANPLGIMRIVDGEFTRG